MRRSRVSAVLFSLFWLVAGIPAPGGMDKLALERRIDGATLIVEATVLHSASFADEAAGRIFTAHRLRVSTVYKNGGEPLDALAEIELITSGGRLGDRMEIVRPALELHPGATGMFFIVRREAYAGRERVWLPYGSKQGFVSFRPDGSAVGPFDRFGDVDRELRDAVRQRAGSALTVFAEPPAVGGGTAQGAGPVISSLSPPTVRGGVGELLTISGSDFGTHTAYAAVLFDSPEDGMGGSLVGTSFLHILFWSDTQIMVLVPDGAGTGQVIVRDAAGLDGVSPTNLTVEYGLAEIVDVAVMRLSEQDENDRGGYTYKYSISTANNGVSFDGDAAAKARFEQSLDLWKCSTGWNADVDGTTSVAATGDDGVNIVAYDNDTDPLPAGVFAQTSNFLSPCGNDWYVTGTDIRFRRDGSGVSWYYGSDPLGISASESDFATIAIHELGHSGLLQHVNDTNDVMYYATGHGTAVRTLTAANIAGGNDMVNYSTSFAGCGTTGMIAFQCGVAPTARIGTSTQGGCDVPLMVDFTDLSYNGPTSWEWSFGDGGTAVTRNPSHTYTSQGVYSVSLTAFNASGSDSITELIAVTDPPATASCDPTFEGHTDIFDVGITRFVLNTIDNVTGTPTDGDPLLHDFTCSGFTVLEPGATYAVQVDSGFPNPEDVRVYVDWNDDGVLAAGELAFSSEDASSHSGTITVPSGAVQDVALRVRVLSDYFPQGILQACENIEFGQVEEYSVLVVDAAAAPPGAVPDTSLLVGKDATGDLDLSWSASCGAGAADYTVHEGTLGSWYSHTSSVCTTGGATSLDGWTPGAGNRYFVVVPVSATTEGSYGTDSGSTERPVSTATCEAIQDTTACL